MSLSGWIYIAGLLWFWMLKCSFNCTVSWARFLLCLTLTDCTRLTWNELNLHTKLDEMIKKRVSMLWKNHLQISARWNKSVLLSFMVFFFIWLCVIMKTNKKGFVSFQPTGSDRSQSSAPSNQLVCIVRTRDELGYTLWETQKNKDKSGSAGPLRVKTTQVKGENQ